MPEYRTSFLHILIKIIFLRIGIFFLLFFFCSPLTKG